MPLTVELDERVSKGIKKELLPIVKLEGIGRVRGRILYNAGYKTIDDIKRAEPEYLINLLGSATAKKVKEQVGGKITQEEWEDLGKPEEHTQKALTEF